MLCVVKPVFQYVKREVVWKKTNYPFRAKARVTDGIIKGHYESTLDSFIPKYTTIEVFLLSFKLLKYCVFIEGHAGAAVEISNVFGSMNNRIEEIVREEEQTRLTGHKPFSEETQGISSAFDFASPLVRDNNDKELFSFSLQRVVKEEETQELTSPSVHNSTESSEEIDLMQSIQIRRARILNLTEKRDRLLNLAGLRTNRL